MCRFVETCGENVLLTENRQAESSVLDNFGARLRSERKKLGFTQKDFAKLGGVGLGAQHRYEAGGATPDADYLTRIGAAGVDAMWVLTGRRSGESLTAEQSHLLEAFSDMDETDRHAILRLASSVSGRPFPPCPPPLPSARALEQMFLGLLDTLDLSEGKDAIAHELAELLPTGLSVLQGPLIEKDRPDGDRAAAAEALSSADHGPR